MGLVKRDLRFRRTFIANEIAFKVLIYLYHKNNLNLIKFEGIDATFGAFQVNRCILSDRSRAVFRRFKVSRIEIKHLEFSEVIPASLRNVPWHV